MHKNNDRSALSAQARQGLSITRELLAEMRERAVVLEISNVGALSYDEHQQLLTLYSLLEVFDSLGLERPFHIGEMKDERRD